MDNLPIEEETPENSIDEKIEEEKKKLPTIGTELQRFIEQITALSMTLYIVMATVLEAFHKKDEESQYYVQNQDQFIDPKSNKTPMERFAYIQGFQDANKQLRIYNQAMQTLPRSYLMALISHYDAFLGKLIKLIILAKPDLLTASEKNLSLAQLLEFGSIENAKDFILEKEIEGVLRKSHAEQFSWMESKFSIPLRKDLDIWSDFIEITERRNLYVHTGGIVSSQYLKVCQDNGVSTADVKIGDELSVQPKYFQHAYNVIFELAFKLAHVLWRKFLPDDLEAADRNLIEVGYEDALHKENYYLTQKIFGFATQTIKKHSSEENRIIMIVNRALGYKWGENPEKAKQIVAQEDWSATMTKFRLAEAVIRDEYETVYSYMREIGNNSTQVHKFEYRNWSLFRAIRKEVKFQEIFQEIFGEPFEQVEVSSIVVPGSPSENGE